MEVKLNKKEPNPFEGMTATLRLFNQASGNVTEEMIDAAWKEVTSKEKKQLFYSILFSIGDIIRQHNIFHHQKKDNGGNANRTSFDVAFRWMMKNQQKQFVKFLNCRLFNEFQCFDTLLENRIVTKKGTKQVVQTKTVLEPVWYRSVLASFIVDTIKSDRIFDKILVAKFLTLPRLSKRQGHKQMLPETKKAMLLKVDLLKQISDKMNWEYSIVGNKPNFKGYRNWRREFNGLEGKNGMFESVLFSTGKIDEMDKTEFFEWLDKLPAGARFRVRNKVKFSKVKGSDTEYRWPKLAIWFEEWEKFKEQKQAEQRKLEEKERQGLISEEEKEKLKAVKKEAKVTVGASNFPTLFEEICSNTVDELKLEQFVHDKVNLPYNSLCIVDASGSMMGRPYQFASFMASVCLAKSPDDDTRNTIAVFSNNCKFYSYIDSISRQTSNSLLRAKSESVGTKPLYNPEKSFYENYQNIKNFLRSKYDGGATYISSVLREIENMLNGEPRMIDILTNYPVWTIISDSEFNNLARSKDCISHLLEECKVKLGFKPFIVAIGVQDSWGSLPNAQAFEGIENFMFVNNPSQIEQVLTNFNDIDIYDVYTPLLSLYRSNRYELIREAVL